MKGIRLISYLHIFIYTALLLTACNNNASTPTRGEQKLVIDESYTQLFIAEIEAFEGFYKDSKFESLYKPEGEVVDDFLKDSCRVIVLSRDLTKQEKDFFTAKKSFPVSTRIAVDALAFITHKDNPIKNLTYNEVRNIFSGNITNWKALGDPAKAIASRDTALTIVFDNVKSCNVRMLKEKILDGKDFPKNIYAVKTNPEVIDYVSKNKNALGIIGVNWISDSDDSLTRNFLTQVNVLAISSEKEPENFYQPYQAYIAENSYPFCRDVYIINREGRTGLGTGFVAFIASDKGQLIILKAGMVPATMPIRMVKITNE